MAGSTIETPLYDERYEDKIIKEKKPLPKPKQGDPLFEQLKNYLQEAIILLVTINDHEKWAVLDHLDPPKADGNPEALAAKPVRWFDDATNTTMTLGMFADHKAALIQAKMGNDCRNEIENALGLMPNIQLIIAVGVAYGSKKYKYADVLVSTTIDGVDNVKHLDKKVIFREGDNRSTRMTNRVIQVFSRETRSWIIETGFKCSNLNRHPNVITGLLISGPWLVDDEEYLLKLFDNDPEARGGEMEGQVIASISNKLHSQPTPRQVDIVIIKGVADFADGKKPEGKKWQLTAAMAAASYTQYKLKESGGSVYKLDPSANKKTDPSTTTSGPQDKLDPSANKQDPSTTTSGPQGPVNSDDVPIKQGKLFAPTDFGSVTRELWDVHDQYLKLGAELGLPPSDINAIKLANMGQPDSCFYEVIRKCIDKGLYQGDIIKALKSPQLNKTLLANELRRKYNV